VSEKWPLGAYGNLRFRTQLGLTYLYLATEGHLPEFRRHAVASVEHLVALMPKTANELVRAGLEAHLARPRTAAPKNQNTSEDEKPTISKQPRLLAYLASSAAFGEDTEASLREQLLAESVVLAHHPEICECLWVYTRSREIILVSQVETPVKCGSSCAGRHA
jgi:hypothetical protein